jgi:fission process protein 1
MAGKDEKPSAPVDRATATGRDYSKLPEREPLPAGMQKILDKADRDDSIYDELWDGT